MKCDNTNIECQKGLWAHLPRLERLEPVLLLLTRITVGWVFLQSGIGKFSHLDKVESFFNSLGIPMAHLQAPFVAAVEVVGGLCLILGFFSRLLSLPLVVTMVVALLTAKKDDVTDLGSLFFLPEFLFIILLLFVIAKGAGCYSLDWWLCRRWHNKK